MVALEMVPLVPVQGAELSEAALLEMLFPGAAPLAADQTADQN